MDIDCRGKACPHPVLMAKQALEEMREGEVVLIVDNDTARENVERFVRSQGCSVRSVKKEGDIYIYIEKKPQGPEVGRMVSDKEDKVVVYINSQFLGVGEQALGSVLMRSFLKTLLELENKPARIILINSGVRLSVEGSEVLDTLTGLSERGVEILSCGTCLDFYGLKDKVRVGTVTNMYEIARTLMEADRLIRP